MRERIKQYLTKMDPAHALRYLAVGFATVFLALVGLGIVHAYDAYKEKEENAWLLAADLLRMRDAREEGQTTLYGELIRGRIQSVLADRDSRILSEILRTNHRDALLQTVGEHVEAAVEENRFGFRELRRILVDALRDMNFSSEGTDTEIGESMAPAAVSPFLNTVDPTEIAHRFFGVNNLFKNALASDDTVTVSYCRNVYAVFERKSGKMVSYVAECTPGAPVLTDSECVRAAVEYAAARQGMDGLIPGEAVASRGIYMVYLSAAESGGAWIGVRQDTGSICFFLRA